MIEFNTLAAGRVVRRLRKDKKLSKEVSAGWLALLGATLR